MAGQAPLHVAGGPMGGRPPIIWLASRPETAFQMAGPRYYRLQITQVDQAMVSDAAVANIDNAAAIARLGASSCVHTADVDEAAEAIGRIFCPHALDPLEHSWPDFHALHNCAGFAGLSVNSVAYGGAG